jgi:hypothetical protein
VVSLILMPHFLLSGHFHGKERKQQSIWSTDININIKS